MSLRIGSMLLESLRAGPAQFRRFLCFKSALSIDKLYPQSTVVKPFTPPVSPDGKFTGYIPIEDLQITYCRASGAGGQHIHNTSTKVDLRFHVGSAKWLSELTKEGILLRHATKLNKDGFLIIKSEKTRYQHLNLADAMLKLREIIFKLEDPESTRPPQSEEKIRKSMEKATRERLMEKRRRSLIKAERQGVD